MSAVVCAIRGGPESQPTLKRSVELARETGCPLHLLYVVNLDFLRHVTGGHVQTADEEVTHMGEFILEIAREEAEAAGAEVHTHIRHGQVTPQVIKLANELDADTIVVGRRRPTPEQPTTLHSVVIDFIDKIRTETTAEVVVVEADKADEA